MPAVSFTAPQYTEDDEKREKEALTPDQKEEIEKDVYGRGDAENNHEDHDRDAEEEISWYLEEIPVHEKQDYLDALRECPRLVQTESSANRFMRATNNDPKESAKKLVSYWQMRQKIFGTKAHLPMSLNGALADDIDFMRQKPQYASVLPDKDSHGRTIIFSDIDGVVDKSHDRNTMTRALWYMAHVAMKEQDSQSNGFVFLASFCNFKTLQNFDRISMKLHIQSVLGCLPLNVKAVHIIVSSNLSTMVLRFSMVFMQPHYRVRTVIHNVPNVKVLLPKENFQPYGIDPALIPTSCGGQLELNGNAFLMKQRELEATTTTNDNDNR